MRVIDFHSHWFSRTFFETLAAQSPLPGSVEEKLAFVSSKTGIEIPDPDPAVHGRRWLAEMDRHGVEHLCAFASLPEEAGVVAAAAAAAPQRLSAFTLINPRAEGIAARLETLLGAQGLKGVLLFPALHGYSPDDPALAPVFDVLARHESIVYAHCGQFSVRLRTLLGLPGARDLRHADPLRLVPLAHAWPRIRFVIPHFGAGFLRETLMAGAQAGNLYTDTSSSHSWLATQCPRPTLAQVFESALAAFGPERVLFGTDSTTFPTGWQRARFEEQQAALKQAGVAPAVMERVFALNARTLLRLS